MMGLTVPGMGKQAIVDMIYPVGSIYMSTVKITPAAVFGGEWEQIRGKFLLAEGDTHVAGSTGGEETHALTNAELPAHNHNTSIGIKSLYVDRDAAPDILAGGLLTTSGFSGFMDYTTGNTGNGNAHNNMPPYLAVYVWKRIA